VKKASKTLIAVTASIGLTFGLFSAPAQAAPVTTPTNGQVGRMVTNDSFTLRAGEELEVQAYVQAPVSGANGSFTASSNLAVTPQSGVTPGQKTFRWRVEGCSSQGFVMSETIAPCQSATLLDSGIIQTFKNTTNQDVIVQVNTGTASITFNGSALPTQNSYTLAFKNVTSQNSTNGVIALSDDDSVRVAFSVCIDPSVQAGDTLVWSKTSTKDGSPSDHDWRYQNNEPLTDITVASTPVLRYDNVSARATNFSPGTYQYSLDLLRNNVSVLIACPAGGGGRPTPLFPLGGATVSGTFAVGSTFTATPNQWSRTDGGPAETVTNSYDWVVCSAPQTTSTTSPEDVPCIATQDSYEWVLADSNSLGSDYDARLDSPTLTISQTLLDLLAGKHLMVVIGGQAANPSASSYLFMETCGPITAGLVCSVAFGTSNPTVDTPAANTPTPPPTPTPTASTPAVGTAAALAALPKSSTQPKLKFAASDNGLSSSAKKSLKKVAKVAKTGYAVRVTGAAGMQAGVSETTVKALAKKRAMAIRAYLIKQGVPKEDIIIKTKVFPIGKAPVTKVRVEVIK
jgi:hypothetical protein